MRYYVSITLIAIICILNGCQNEINIESIDPKVVQQIDLLKEIYNNEINIIQTRVSELEEMIMELKEDSTELRNQNEELVQKISSYECQIDSPYPYISDTKANCLISTASKTIMYLNNGGENGEITSDYAKIKINDPQISSKENIMSLLNESFSPEISKEFYEIFAFEIIEGQMYRPMADLVFPGWGEQLTIVDRSLKEKKCTITFKRRDTWDEEVEFVFLEKQGWRINTKTW